MEQIDFDDGLAEMLDSLLNGRLVLLAGAGLSMAAPSCLPSAAELAARAKQRYDAMYGEARPPLAQKIEEQAEFFFDRGELETVYFGNLVDRHAFGGPPNAGHLAAADLLIIRALVCAVTTNVDVLLESAGNAIFGEVSTAIDGTGASALPAVVAPLLKIHGCRVRDPAHMIWAPGQLCAEPVAGRIAR